MGPDIRDPRMSPDVWPCHNKHTPQVGNNRYARWKECVTCGVRLEYVPAMDAPAQSAQTNLPQNVTEALHRLRSGGHQANDLTARIVKAQVVIVSKEKIVDKKGYPKKAEAKPKVKIPNAHEVAVEESDGDFQCLDDLPESEKEKKKGRQRGS